MLFNKFIPFIKQFHYENSLYATFSTILHRTTQFALSNEFLLLQPCDINKQPIEIEQFAT